MASASRDVWCVQFNITEESLHLTPGELHILEKIMKENDTKLRELWKVLWEQKEVVLKKNSRNHNRVAKSDESVTDFECYHGDLSEASPEKLREHIEKLESVLLTTKQKCNRELIEWFFSFMSCIQDRVSEQKTYGLKISTINDELSEYKQKLDLAVSEMLMFQKHAEDSKLDYQTKIKTLTENYKEDICDIVVQFNRQMRALKLADMYKKAASLVNNHGSVANLPQSFQESDLPGKLHILEKIMKENDAKLRELEKVIQEQKEVSLKKVSRNHNCVAKSDGSDSDFECYHGDLSEASPEKLREYIKKLVSALLKMKQKCNREVSEWIFSLISCIQDWVTERKTYEMKISTINDELSECKQKLDLVVSETLMFQKHAEDSKLDYQTKMKILVEKYKEDICNIVVKFDRQMKEFEEKLAEMYEQSAASLVNKHDSIANLPQSFQESDLPGKLHILKKIMKEKDAKLRQLEKVIQEQKVSLKKVSRNHNHVAVSDGTGLLCNNFLK